MTVRLEEAAVAHEVRTAHIRTEQAGLADALTVPLAPEWQPPAPPAYPTPVAALLERAHRRIAVGGWCAGALTDGRGAVCLLGAVREAAGGDRGLEAGAVRVLMDAIERRFGDRGAPGPSGRSVPSVPPVPSVPSFNDAWGTGRVPLRILHEAAVLADARGV
ncbi:hypothetical protein ACFCVY_13310 [Streptomyces sp. NPDC056411]